MPRHGIAARTSTAVAMAVCGLLISLHFRICSARSLQSQHPDHCSRRIFWFMGITTRSSVEYWRYGACCSDSLCKYVLLLARRHQQSRPFAAKVAVLSAKERSPNLIPVLLYGGSSGDPSPAAEANLQWYREAGGIVYPHNLTFMSELQVHAELTCAWNLEQCRRHLCSHCNLPGTGIASKAYVCLICFKALNPMACQAVHGKMLYD